MQTNVLIKYSPAIVRGVYVKDDRNKYSLLSFAGFTLKMTDFYNFLAATHEIEATASTNNRWGFS